MAVSAEQVKALRDATGVSMIECKKALEAADGNMDKALDILRARSNEIAAKKSDRALGAGVVASYIHSTGQVGAMVVLSSETDFVSKNEEFSALARDIAMHAAAMRPQNVAELLEQPFIKDSTQTIAGLISGATQKFGERVEISSLSVASVA
ncbi:MAG TPA: elongation factor Ts [Candidatus Paceibacterota bacterium]|nr:elongation factor Ts [Candidatus Paceibacterota bacterium]